MGGALHYCNASFRVNGSEFWRSVGTAAGSFLLRDIYPGWYGSYPRSLVALNNALLFAADAPVNGSEVWRSDGSQAGTVLVKNIAPGANGSDRSPVVVCQGCAYFAADDRVHGTELWRTDGTAAGTTMVADVIPGPVSGTFGVLPAVDGVLYLLANDGAGGSVLWRTNGTAAGTVPVTGLYLGGGMREIAVLARIEPDGLRGGSIAGLNGALIDDADNGTTGPEPWILDPKAPDLTLPADQTEEATSPSGATVEFEATAGDNLGGSIVPHCLPASGSTFPLGDTSVACTAHDETGNPAGASFRVTVRDTTAPKLTVPSGITVNATGAGGAVVQFFPTAADAADPSPDVSCTPASGSWFAVGTTCVSCTATDASGNVAQASFQVTVSAAGMNVELGSLALGIGLGALIAVAAVLAFLRYRRKPTAVGSQEGEPPKGDPQSREDDWDL